MLRNILLYIMVGMLSVTTSFNKVDMMLQKEPLRQVANTNIYTDYTIVPDDLYDVVSMYNVLPTSVTELLKQNNIKIYLVEKPSLYTDRFNYIGKASYIESNPKNIVNLSSIEKDGKFYVVYHGTEIGPYDTEDEIDWTYLTEKYLRESDKYGKNYFSYKKNVVLSDNMYSFYYRPMYNIDVSNSIITRVQDGYIEYYTNTDVKRPDMLLHAIGLVFDDLVGLISGNAMESNAISSLEEWHILYDNNREQLSVYDDITPIFVTSDYAGGFAEVFRLILLDTRNFRDRFPEIYDFVLRELTIYGNNVVNINVDNFNYKGYADRYSDIKEAFGYNRNLLYQHYLEYGILEQRIG